ncbi:MAG TPA: hypothetical protein VNH83_08195 [Bryobacteraceae bacterium]|nr:hypothetical protein [Bryobacteraceae bacterium]
MGSDTLLIQASDLGGRSIQAIFQIPILTQAPTITTASLPNASQGIAYSTQLAAINGVGPLSWFFTSSTGTNSWAISPTGLLTGTPANIETDNITFGVQDALGNSTPLTLSLIVTAAGGVLTITANGGLPVPPAAQGVPYELIFNCAGGTGALTWSKLSGPAWGSINSAVSGLSATQALFSGTPPSITGGDTFTLQVTDSLSNTGTITFTC